MAEHHIHLPTRDDADRCGLDGCGLFWNDPVHAPSVALRRLQELPPDLRDLAATERASGPPSVPAQRGAAPATHTGRPAMHSGAQHVPADARWIMCPGRFRTQDRHTLQCPYSSPLRAEVADHLVRVHKYHEGPVGFYLAHPWFASESRSSWVKRTAHLRRPSTQNITNFVDGPGMDTTEYCDHPNGFGPNGCPCGASREEEDGPDMFRNLNTGEDERAIECPECPGVFPETRIWKHLQSDHSYPGQQVADFLESIGFPAPGDDERYDHSDGSPIWDHPISCPECGNAFVKHNIRQHLQTAHSYTGDEWTDWAESVNFLELPTVPKSILDDMEAVGLRAEQEMAKFMNPDVTMEQIMSDAVTPPESVAQEEATIPPDLERVITTWWLDRAKEEAGSVVPKAIAYGSNSLMQLGRKMAQLQGREITDDEALELGCWVNTVQKIERWTDSVMRGERCSDDTIYDAGVYLKMVQRIRDVGSWPGLPNN